MQDRDRYIGDGLTHIANNLVYKPLSREQVRQEKDHAKQEQAQAEQERDQAKQGQGPICGLSGNMCLRWGLVAILFQFEFSLTNFVIILCGKD